jgi:TPP-dependent trihydroxycyclohexane-1,2-dione (THcHDO) dehydratase
MATLNVGAGQAYATQPAAVAVSHDGDVIAAPVGTHVNDFATISKDITIG